MATFYGQTRSNYFAVKDEAAFREELSKYPVRIIEDVRDGRTLVGFLDADSNGAGDIDSIWDEKTQESSYMDWEDFFRRHLEDGWVATIISVGWEAYRYLEGRAVAYNNRGETREFSINDITLAGAEIGEHCTDASY